MVETMFRLEFSRVPDMVGGREVRWGLNRDGTTLRSSHAAGETTVVSASFIRGAAANSTVLQIDFPRYVDFNV